jgi:hypothetical protein
MFFGKNKKTDSKIRFQQTGFRRQLQSARSYKREGGKNAGLGRLLVKISAGLIAAGLLYLVYAPTFLSLKNITVTGIGQSGQQQITELISNYIKSSPLKAQSNWLFLSDANLAQYIFQRDNDITAVNSVKKKFSNTLTVAVTPRITAFNVITPLQQLLVSNDGLVRQDITGLGTSTITSETAGLINLSVDSASSTIIGQRFLPDNLISAINQLRNLTQTQLGLTIDHFEVANLQATDLSEYVTLGFKMMFDTTVDLGQAVNQARLILNSLAGSQQKNLYYLDLRFGGKAYVCYQNTACVQNVPIIQTTATTTTP